MKIVVIEGCPFGKFYFNPQTHEGIAVNDRFDPVVIGMKKDWNPYTDPDAVTMDVDADVYKRLMDAAAKRDKPGVDSVLKEYFERPKK